MSDYIKSRTASAEASERPAGDHNPSANNGAADTAKVVIPPEIKKLLGKPNLLFGEDEAEYWAFVEMAACTKTPKSLPDWINVVDYAENHRNVQSCRGAKSHVVKAGRTGAIKRLVRKTMELTDLDRGNEAERIALKWHTDPKVRGEASELLKALGLPEDCFDSQSFVDHIGIFSQIDTFESKLISRRDAAIREINRRREEVVPPDDCGNEEIKPITEEPEASPSSSDAPSVIPDVNGDKP
jgi:hypothetical protein